MYLEIRLNNTGFLVILFNFLILLGSFNVSTARKRVKPPLIEDSARRRAFKQTHCQFGNETYGINERWRPNLGPPFGVLFCVHCECTPVQKKHRKEVVARVRCRNIKNDCPKPSCDNPVLLPEGCCKTCPSEETTPMIVKSTDNGRPEESSIPVTILSTPMSSTTPSSKSPEVIKTTAKNDNYLEDDSNDIMTSGYSFKCYYEKEIYEDGTQWKSKFDDCQMCSCQRGRVKCDQVMCPIPGCANPVTVSGECCSTCVGDSSLTNSNLTKPRGCYFEGDKKFHVAASKWHPYLPPFGFDRCSLCTCLQDTLTIECKRSVVCPPLPCPEYEAYRENPMDCCKRCPNAISVKSIATLDQLGDERAKSGWVKSPNELLFAGGCSLKGRVYANGDEWHPTVQPYGEIKCVKCRCKDKQVKCKRTKCQKLRCAVKINKDDECCPKCADLNKQPHQNWSYIHEVP